MFVRVQRSDSRSHLIWWAIPFMVAGFIALMWLAGLGEKRQTIVPMRTTAVAGEEPPAQQHHGTTEQGLGSKPTSPHCGFCLAKDLWKGIRALDASNPYWDAQATTRLWSKMRLGRDLEFWRQIALAGTHLNASRLSAAADAINTAHRIDREHPLVHFYQGIVWLRYSTSTPDWDRPMDLDGPMYVATVVNDKGFGPYTPSIYRSLASASLQRAIDKQGNGWLDRPLTPFAWAAPRNMKIEMPLLCPTARDLLRALGTENYLGIAHRWLGELDLERGALLSAEHHLDQATGLGMSVEKQYLELAGAYHQQSDLTSAMRASWKALVYPKRAGEQPPSYERNREGIPLPIPQAGPITL